MLWAPADFQVEYSESEYTVIQICQTVERGFAAELGFTNTNQFALI